MSEPAARLGAARAGQALIGVARRPALPAAAMLSVLAGLWGGLSLLGTGVPLPDPALAAQHGPLMALGFLGTLISLERAVALGRLWGYAAPALAAAGALVIVAGPVQIGRLLLTLAAGWFIGVYLALLARRPGVEIVAQLLGAAAWYAGGLLWLRGLAIADLVPWLTAFLVLTIAGERLELAHVSFDRAGHGVAAAMGLLGVGVVASVFWPDAGWRLAGLGMLALAGLLAVHDVARRTVRATGLPRYAAACLLAGYVWLAVTGAIWAALGKPTAAGGYDAALHVVFLGFVISMVFGHAPVILPAVLRIRLPYHPMMYGPLALLHAALLVRVAGDLGGVPAARTVGGVLGETALLGFAGCAVAASRLSSRKRPAPRGTGFSSPAAEPGEATGRFT